MRWPLHAWGPRRGRAVQEGPAAPPVVVQGLDGHLQARRMARAGRCMLSRCCCAKGCTALDVGAGRPMVAGGGGGT